MPELARPPIFVAFAHMGGSKEEGWFDARQIGWRFTAVLPMGGTDHLGDQHVVGEMLVQAHG